MSFMGFFPSESERRLARDEAADALEKHGDQAEAVLTAKARQTRSPKRRTIYRLARQFVQQRKEA